MWKFDGHDVRACVGRSMAQSRGGWSNGYKRCCWLPPASRRSKWPGSPGRHAGRWYALVARYCRRRRPGDLDDRPRKGRPKASPVITAGRIKTEYRRDPLALGYMATEWTVPLLAGHLSRRYHCALKPRTLRRRLKAMGLAWKRPKYVYHSADPNRGQKGSAGPPCKETGPEGHGALRG